MQRTMAGPLLGRPVQQTSVAMRSIVPRAGPTAPARSVAAPARPVFRAGLCAPQVRISRQCMHDNAFKLDVRHVDAWGTVARLMSRMAGCTLSLHRPFRYPGDYHQHWLCKHVVWIATALFSFPVALIQEPTLCQHSATIGVGKTGTCTQSAESQLINWTG